MKYLNAIVKVIGITLVVIVTLVFIPAHAATIEGLVWMDSPCEGCIAVIKDLGDGNLRVIYMDWFGVHSQPQTSPRCDHRRSHLDGFAL